MAADGITGAGGGMVGVVVTHVRLSASNCARASLTTANISAFKRSSSFLPYRALPEGSEWRSKVVGCLTPKLVNHEEF